MKRLIAALGLLLMAVAINPAKADSTQTYASSDVQIIRQPITAGFNLIGVVNVAPGATSTLGEAVALGLNEFLVAGAELYAPATPQTTVNVSFVKVAVATRVPPYTLEILVWTDPITGIGVNSNPIAGGAPLFLHSSVAGTLVQIGAAPAGSSRTFAAAKQTGFCPNVPQARGFFNADSLNLPAFSDGCISFLRFDRAAQVWSNTVKFDDSGWYDDLQGFSDVGPDILPGEGLVYDNWENSVATWVESAPAENPEFYASTGGIRVDIFGQPYTPITGIHFTLPSIAGTKQAGYDLIFVRQSFGFSREMQEWVRIDGSDFIGQCPRVSTALPEEGVERVGIRRCAIAVLP